MNSLATDYDVDLYVTGSNSRMMSLEIATYLTGRYVSFRIYTLSFREYLDFKKQYAQLKGVHGSSNCSNNGKVLLKFFCLHCPSLHKRLIPDKTSYAVSY